jgi:type VI protein secretion system component VasK
MRSVTQLRQLRAVYAGGVLAWTLSLLLSSVWGEGSARQTVVLLVLLAAFLVLLLWSTWCLWEATARRTAAGTASVAAAAASAPAERS